MVAMYKKDLYTDEVKNIVICKEIIELINYENKNLLFNRFISSVYFF